MDKLDLLGVKYDYEMELSMKYDMAKEVSDYWKKVFKEQTDFYEPLDSKKGHIHFKENCIFTISMRLNEKKLSKEVLEIWEIIEKNYGVDNL